MLADLRPEEQLCCLLCRRNISEQTGQVVGSLMRTGINWGAFLDLTFRHRIYPLVYHHMSQVFAETVPREVLKRLQVHAVTNAKRSEAMANELAGVLDLLASAGIRAVPLKGPVLIERIWGDSRLGVYHDLDILVKPEDARHAVHVLLQRGYRLRDTHPLVRSEWNQGSNPVVLVRNHELGFRLLIDLHHTLVEHKWIGRAVGRPEHLWEHLESSNFAGAAVWLLPDDWNLVLLALHTLQHWFRLLHWVAEFWGLGRLCPGAWPDALQRAREIDADREVSFLSRVSDMILGETLTTSSGVPRFVARLAQGPFKPLNSEFALHRFQLAVRSGAREKIAYLLSFPFVPTPSDWTFLPLPSRLRPVHYVLRPIRLIVTYLIWLPLGAAWRFSSSLLRPFDNSRPRNES